MDNRIETRETVDDFEFYNYAENHIRAILKGDNPYLTLGAAETTKQLHIPYPHRLVKFILRQTDSANADNRDDLNVQIRRDVGQIIEIAQGKDILFTKNNNRENAVFTAGFGDGYEFEETTWTLAFKGTATNRIHIIVYFQRIFWRGN